MLPCTGLELTHVGFADETVESSEVRHGSTSVGCECGYVDMARNAGTTSLVDLFLTGVA